MKINISDFSLGLLFAGFAALQFNDPDPTYWVVVYGATGTLCFFASANRFNEFWTVITIGALLAGMVIALDGFGQFLLSQDYPSLVGPMLAEKPWVEPAREFLGLGIATVTLLRIRIRHRSVK